MNKIAQITSLWPQIYQKLKSPPAGLKLGDLPSKLPPLNKIKIEHNRSSDNPQAIGYVTTEDTDSNGELDTIHISTPRLEDALRQSNIPLDKIKNINELTNEQLISLLSPFVEIISHEMGHLKDYKPGSEKPFPGGESVAESAARSALQQISIATTNNKISVEAMEQINMEKETLDILIDLADKLDKIEAKGTSKAADKIDEIIAKFAQIQPTPVPMGQDYAGQSVTQKSVYDPATGQYKSVVTDRRKAPLTPEEKAIRTAESKKRFTADTNLQPGEGLDNIKNVQQKLLDLGHDIGAKTPDLDWGPKSTAAWTKFYADTMDTVPSDKKQWFMTTMDSGNITYVLSLMDWAKDLKALSPLAVTPKTLGEISKMESQGMDVRSKLKGPEILRLFIESPQNERSAFPTAFSDLYAKAKDHLRNLDDNIITSVWRGYKELLEPTVYEDLKKLFTESHARMLGVFKAQHPENIATQMDNQADDEDFDILNKKINEQIIGTPIGTTVPQKPPAQPTETKTSLSSNEKVKKIAEDAEKYREIFWSESRTPFGR